VSIIQSLIYGLISGLAEFLPVSSHAHQALLMQMYGATHREPLRDLMVHIALIFSLMIAGRSLFSRIRREKSLSSKVIKGRLRRATAKSLVDLQIARTAMIPMLMLMLIYFLVSGWEFKPGVLSVVLIINGIIIIVPEYMRHGNKDARAMSATESVLIGILSGLSAFPGISRIGTGLSGSIAGGADRQHATNWVLLLSLPALCAYIIIDIVGLFVYGFGAITFVVFIGYVLGAGLAFIGGYISVVLLRVIAERASISAFAFYSWGMALFMFILYLIT